ncbi:hypothetical protein ASAC_0364 [Acidilobus saccharovorans 345-15]|uniref:Uncharacterized protein n=1 Tax=Acidilobus saccharovorans (strain DSM 16705 / JCM 18335 / VKM B-2471 / 345-15) TaxID=666510 RepID=D9Q0D3_ACIS3|nr:hypothetical protein [Acidilobus saccharovorans]ADL18771.1 hypothetical protein ASAC_0364 [Acidilobus saccharovorans 345-15]
MLGQPDADSLVKECGSLKRWILDTDGIPTSLKLAIDDQEAFKDELPRLAATSRHLIDVLINKYRAEVEIPRNVDPVSEFKVTAWPDLVNEELGLVGLVLYSWFPFSIYRGDNKAEYEPIELVFARNNDNDYRLLFAYARVHYDLCEYNLAGLSKVTIRFLYHGHTPFIDGLGYIRLKCPKVKSSARRVGRKYWDRIWLGTALTFEKIVKGTRMPLSLLLKLGTLTIMQCPNHSTANPFRSPITIRI